MFTLLALALSSAAQCPAENARYVLRGAPEVTARFREVDSGPEWPSGLALATRFERSGHTYWWLPRNGGTDHRQNVASTTNVDAPGWRPPSPDGGHRPFGNMEYLAADAAYNVINDIPHRGAPAPAHFLLADLGNAEYRHGAGERQVPDTRQFFDLVSCGGGGSERRKPLTSTR